MEAAKRTEVRDKFGAAQMTEEVPAEKANNWAAKIELAESLELRT